MRQSRTRHDEGFTLIELLIAMAMTAIVLAAVFTFAIAQANYLSTREQVTQLTQGVRAAMDMLTHEIDIAGYDPPQAGFSGVTFNAAQLQLRADLNGDGDTDDATENVIYTYDAGGRRILRNTGNGNEPLAEQITAFTFQYLDANGNATTVSADIRQLRVTVTARTAKPDRTYTTNGGYRTYTLTSLVTPRNLAY
jgi:type IV pilus assembly protein PilW